MAEHQDSESRTEQPTQKRKQDARKKGQIARSRELNIMLSLLFASAGFLMLGGGIAEKFIAMFSEELSISREAIFNKETITLSLMSQLATAFAYVSPFLLLMLASAFVGPLVMGGILFSPSAMEFKPDRINPVAGLKRLFSIKGLIELVKALFKFFILLGATFLLFSYFYKKIMVVGVYTPEAAIFEITNILGWCLLALSFTLILIVMLDVPFELWNHNKQLKMTRQEIKDEMKETEGRPEVKSKIRSLQQELAQRRMMEAVPSADVIITNPTHFAVALVYKEGGKSAPVVVAKGRDHIAFKIREIAMKSDVTIFSAPPLARALYYTTDIGKEIPRNLYLAVAKVLAYVFQLRTTDSNENVSVPDDLPVPDEYQDQIKDEDS